MDESTTIQALRKRIAKFNDDRDWDKFHNPKDLAISISIEASELLEIFQWLDDKSIKKLSTDAKGRNRIESELADIAIYCLGLSNSLDIDLSKAVQDKITLNEQKYPISKAKGSAKKYTEL